MPWVPWAPGRRCCSRSSRPVRLPSRSARATQPGRRSSRARSSTDPGRVAGQRQPARTSCVRPHEHGSGRVAAAWCKRHFDRQGGQLQPLPDFGETVVREDREKAWQTLVTQWGPVVFPSAPSGLSMSFHKNPSVTGRVVLWQSRRHLGSFPYACRRLLCQARSVCAARTAGR